MGPVCPSLPSSGELSGSYWLQFAHTRVPQVTFDINTAIEFSKLNSAQKPDEKLREAFDLVTHGQKLNPD